MDTCGGANSGKTSSGARARVPMPTTTKATASPSTTPRCRIELRTSPLSTGWPPGSLARLVAHRDPGAELFGEQLLRAGHHYGVARRERRAGDPAAPGRVVGRDPDPEVAARRALQVGPG